MSTVNSYKRQWLYSSSIFTSSFEFISHIFLWISLI
jgi:hypothetical protein